MIADWQMFIAIGSFCILLAGMFGGYISLRSTISKANTETQEHVREALKDENEILQSRVLRVEGDLRKQEAENRRLNDMMNLIIEIFQKRGIVITIDGDMVQVKDNGTTFKVRQKTPDQSGTAP